MKYGEHSARQKWHHSFLLLGWKAPALPVRGPAPDKRQLATAGCKTQLPLGPCIKPSSNSSVFDTQPYLYNQYPHSSPTLSFCPTMPFERRCSVSIGHSCWIILNKQSDLLTTTSEKMTEKKALWLLPHFLPLGVFANSTGEILTPLKSQ